MELIQDTDKYYQVIWEMQKEEAYGSLDQKVNRSLLWFADYEKSILDTNSSFESAFESG